MNKKSIVLAVVATLMSLGIAWTGDCATYTASEQYVKNAVAAESNRTDKAISALRQEVIDSHYLTPGSIVAGANVTVTTNADGKVIISSTGGGGGGANIEAGTNIVFGTGAGGSTIINAVVPEYEKVEIDNAVVSGSTNAVSGGAVYVSVTNALQYTINATGSLARVAHTGEYISLAGTPTNVSFFVNDSGYVTESITNGILSAAKKYTDDAIIETGSVTPGIVTNIATYVATNYTDNATNDLVVSLNGKYVQVIGDSTINGKIKVNSITAEKGDNSVEITPTNIVSKTPEGTREYGLPANTGTIALKSDFDELTITASGNVLLFSTNDVTRGALYKSRGSGGGGDITIDQTVEADSQNAVAGGAVYTFVTNSEESVKEYARGITPRYTSDLTNDGTGDGKPFITTITNNAITSAMIASDAVTSSKISNGSITVAKLGNNAVTNAKLANNAVSTDKIQDSSVTLDKLEPDVRSNVLAVSGSIIEGYVKRSDLVALADSIDETTLTNINRVVETLIELKNSLIDMSETKDIRFELKGVPAYSTNNVNWYLFSTYQDTPITVDWGDGTYLRGWSGKTRLTHVYKRQGDYTLRFIGRITGISATSTDSETLPLAKKYAKSVTIDSLPELTTSGFYFTKWNVEDIYFKSIRSLPNNVFENCNLLVSCNLPALKRVSDFAFNGCPSLANISLPQAGDIGELAFYNCYDLGEAIFPVVTNISGYAFSGCTNLMSVTMPSVLSMYDKGHDRGGQFQYCSSLQSVDFPLLNEIPSNAFKGCVKTGSITIKGLKTLPSGSPFADVGRDASIKYFDGETYRCEIKLLQNSVANSVTVTEGGVTTTYPAINPSVSGFPFGAPTTTKFTCSDGYIIYRQSSSTWVVENL